MTLGPYRRVDSSHGQRRSYRIVCGMAPGYDGAAPAPITRALDVVKGWMAGRAERQQPYLTGVLTEATVAYAWRDPILGGLSAEEPCVVLSGDVTPQYLAQLPDEDVVALLDELAALLGAAYEQTRVYVAYRASTWVLEWSGRETPRTE